MLLISSCYTENTQVIVIPDNLFSEEKMVNIMAEVQIVEAALAHHRLHRRGDKTYKEPYYNQVFLEYGITAKDFKQNLNYYNSIPESMEKILEKVLEINNQKLGELENKIREDKIADSLKKIELLNDTLKVIEN